MKCLRNPKWEQLGTHSENSFEFRLPQFVQLMQHKNFYLAYKEKG